MGITVRNHASGGVRGFARGLALLDDEDARVRLQAPRQRESNDAPAYDDNVPSLHISIVVENPATADAQSKRTSLRLQERRNRPNSGLLRKLAFEAGEDLRRISLIDRALPLPQN